MQQRIGKASASSSRTFAPDPDLRCEEASTRFCVHVSAEVLVSQLLKDKCSDQSQTGLYQKLKDSARRSSRFGADLI